jgi:hypothetical protein
MAAYSISSGTIDNVVPFWGCTLVIKLLVSMDAVIFVLVIFVGVYILNKACVYISKQGCSSYYSRL